MSDFIRGKDTVKDLFNDHAVSSDLFEMFCGQRLGEGMSREVYEYLLKKNCVIKFERVGCFQNNMEWETWHRVKYTPFAKWFAPCYRISPCGRILLQAKTKPVDVNKLPDRLPNFFTDLKPDNVGMFKGNLCVHDYGLHLLMEKGMTKRTKKCSHLWY